MRPIRRADRLRDCPYRGLTNRRNRVVTGRRSHAARVPRPENLHRQAAEHLAINEYDTQNRSAFRPDVPTSLRAFKTWLNDLYLPGVTRSSLLQGSASRPGRRMDLPAGTGTRVQWRATPSSSALSCAGRRAQDCCNETRVLADLAPAPVRHRVTGGGSGSSGGRCGVS